MTWLKRILAVLVGLALIAVIAFNLFKAQIAERAFVRAIDRMAGVDRSAALPDGLHVYLCGTGSPMPDATRAGPCLGVLAGDTALVFDIGSGGMRNLGAMGFPIGRMDGVYLTHLHSDHLDGLGELLTIAWVGGNRSEPLPVRGPTGTNDVVAGFNMAYRLDSTFRTAHHGPEIARPSGFGGVADEIVIPAGPGGQLVVHEDGDLKITAIRVSHAPIEPAFGYRIDYKDRSISISGDTIYQERFAAASQGVDIMLHEALNKRMVSTIGAKLGERGLTNQETIFHDILDYHTDPEEAAQAAQEAGAAQLVFYHIVPQLPVKMLESVFIGNSKSIFDGKITVGRDGMILSLPAGSDKIEKSQAL
ncbi:MAG: MBL fold metallo-hydrolase [Pseudomonadota bacterium]|nr:MBL fold metallo-hydrolase [Pseudomonadota bacterium]